MRRVPKDRETHNNASHFGNYYVSTLIKMSLHLVMGGKEGTVKDLKCFNI